MRLAGKVAIVTGAASGIGRATAIRFSQRGCVRGHVRSRHTFAAMQSCRRSARNQGKAIFLTVDVSIEADVCEAIRRTEAEFQRIDVLVNNAAAFVFGSYQVTQTDWERVLSVNIMGAAFCAKYAVERDDPSGRRIHRKCNFDQRLRGPGAEYSLQHQQGRAAGAQSMPGDGSRPAQNPRQRRSPWMHRHAATARRCGTRWVDI